MTLARVASRVVCTQAVFLGLGGWEIKNLRRFWFDSDEGKEMGEVRDCVFLRGSTSDEFFSS